MNIRGPTLVVPSVGAAAGNLWSYFRNLVVRGGSPGVPSAAVSADMSKVLPLRLSQLPLSDVVAADPAREKNAQTISGHMAFCNSELHDKWKVAKQSACHLSMVPHRDTRIHTHPPSLMDFNNRSVPPRSGPGASPRTYSDLLWTYFPGHISLDLLWT